jgi:hypothetical protein
MKFKLNKIDKEKENWNSWARILTKWKNKAELNRKIS